MSSVLQCHYTWETRKSHLTNIVIIIIIVRERIDDTVSHSNIHRRLFNCPYSYTSVIMNVHAALTESEKRSIFAGKMYSCVEWAGDHFGYDLTKIDPL